MNTNTALKIPKINMDYINWLNTHHKYNFKIKQVNDNTLYIDTVFDEWVLFLEPKLHEKYKPILLKHKNHKRNINGYHDHRRFWDFEFAFQSMHQHKFKYIRDFTNSPKKNLSKNI